MLVYLLLLLLVPKSHANETCKIPSTNLTEPLCDYITRNCDQDYQISKYYFCDHNVLTVNYIFIPLLTLILFLFFIAIGIITSNYLSPNLRFISNHCKLNEKISGLTLLSLGNGSTDLFSTYEAMAHGSTSLAIGELIGSSLFLICFVVGIMGVVRPFKVNQYDFIRDLIFFTLLLSVSLYFVQDGVLKYWECIIMCLLYISYLIGLIVLGDRNDLEDLQIDLTKPIIVESSNSVIVLKSNKFDVGYLRKLQRFLTSNDEESLVDLIKKFNNQEQQPLLGADLEIHEYTSIEVEEFDYNPWDFFFNTINNPDEPIGWRIFEMFKFPINFLFKMTIPLMGLKPKKIQFIQHDNENLLEFRIKENRLNLLTSKAYDLEMNFKIKLFNYFQVFIIPFLFINLNITTCTKLIISVSGFFLNFCISRFLPLKPHTFIISIIGFVLTLNYITIITSSTITILKNMGLIMNINESLLGLTVLSLGNSIGDLVSNITLAKIGLHITGLNACFGAPLLYILLGVGINGLITMVRHKQYVLSFEVSSNLLISCIGLFCMLAFYLIMIPRNGWILGKSIGWIAIGWWCFINGCDILLEMYH